MSNMINIGLTCSHSCWYMVQALFFLYFTFLYVVTTLPYSTLFFKSLIISVKRYARIYVVNLMLSLLFISHILTNTKFKNVSSTYYHSSYLVFEFTFDVTYFHSDIDIKCMRSYLMYQTLHIMFSVVTLPKDVSVSEESLFLVHVPWFSNFQGETHVRFKTLFFLILLQLFC